MRVADIRRDSSRLDVLGVTDEIEYVDINLTQHRTEHLKPFRFHTHRLISVT